MNQEAMAQLIIRACIWRCANAQDGRGRYPAIAAATAAAARSVGEVIARRAAT